MDCRPKVIEQRLAELRSDDQLLDLPLTQL